MIRHNNARVLMLVLTLVALTTSISAGVPNTINYQGRLTDDGGQAVSGSKLMKFKIYGSLLGDDSLWSSNFRAVQIDNGLFNVQLGLVVPLPEDLFTGDDARYLGITFDTDAEMTPRTRFITLPYAFHASKADTSDWAFGGPGAGVWVDDGNVVRLASSDDNVGIGTATASEKLVVGQDIGFYGGKYIVSGSPWLDDVCGFKMGYSADNHTTLQWNGDGNPFAIHTREGGVDYNNTFVLNSGKVGIGTESPGFRLEVKSSGYADGFRVTSSDGSQLFRIRENSAGSCETYISDDAGNTGVMLRGTGNSYFNSGKVAIGTSAPEYAGLYVYQEGTSYTVETIQNCIGLQVKAITDVPIEASPAYGIKSYAESMDGTACGLYAEGKSSGSMVYAYGLIARAIGTNPYQTAGFFQGDVSIHGSLSKTGGSFKIDHPLDPENKYLQHSFVESPDMMNVYNGNVVLDDEGKARIELPEWFEALNREFRYQLTCIGGYAPVYIEEEISGNSFAIAGGVPGLKVSWQVTGIRQDPWAEANRIPVETDKNPLEKGLYRHPEVYGQPEEKGISYQLIEKMRNSSKK